MENDKLKQRIAQDRSAFEQDEPSVGLWEKIATDLAPEQEEAKSRFPWAAAASVAMLIGLLGLSYYLGGKHGQPITADSHGQETIELGQISAELAEIDQYYSIQVGQKMQQLSVYQVDADLMEELDFLYEEFEVLKQEIGQGIDDGKVVEALIQNYRLRLSLLEDLLKAVNPQSEGSINTKDEHEV